MCKLRLKWATNILRKGKIGVPGFCLVGECPDPAWANHIRVILAANVTTATAMRTMTKTVPISTMFFTV
jgi:hypothetical protein